MSADYVVIGHFSDATRMAGAIRILRAEGHDKALEYFSPIPHHELEEEMYKGKKRSWVRFFTLLGGLTGLSGAFLMTCWMSIDYPLRVSAKPLLSIPSFVVIAFECTILLGGIFTLLSMFHFCRIPNISHWGHFRPNFTDGTFGLTLRLTKEQSEEFEKRFQAFGAEKVEVQYVR